MSKRIDELEETLYNVVYELMYHSVSEEQILNVVHEAIDDAFVDENQDEDLF